MLFSYICRERCSSTWTHFSHSITLLSSRSLKLRVFASHVNVNVRNSCQKLITQASDPFLRADGVPQRPMPSGYAVAVGVGSPVFFSDGAFFRCSKFWVSFRGTLLPESLYSSGYWCPMCQHLRKFDKFGRSPENTMMVVLNKILESEQCLEDSISENAAGLSTTTQKFDCTSGPCAQVLRKPGLCLGVRVWFVHIVCLHLATLPCCLIPGSSLAQKQKAACATCFSLHAKCTQNAETIYIPIISFVSPFIWAAGSGFLHFSQPFTLAIAVLCILSRQQWPMVAWFISWAKPWLRKKMNKERSTTLKHWVPRSKQIHFMQFSTWFPSNQGIQNGNQRDASGRSFTNWQELTFLGGKESCDKISLWCDKRNAKEIFLWSSGDVPMEDPKVSEKEQIAERGDDEALMNSKILKLVGMDDYDT